jgi:Protein of unknown function (DUF3768)
MTIAEQNDAFRAQLTRLPAWTAPRIPGRHVLTRGIASLGPDRVLRILRGVEAFASFTNANDPHDEHDFGIFEDDGDRILWKVDYYADDSMTFGAENPAESYRVLTIMFAHEY